MDQLHLTSECENLHNNAITMLHSNYIIVVMEPRIVLNLYWNGGGGL